MKFCILTYPRTGSHMLASALDSHPDIQCKGEVGMEKYPELMGAHEARVQGCIVQNFQLKQVDVRAFDKIIVLLRDTSVRTEYRGVHFLEPTTVNRSIRDASMEKPVVDHYPILAAAMLRENLILSYEKITGNCDIREIPDPFMRQICSFLGVDPHPLRPIFYKPAINAAR